MKVGFTGTERTVTPQQLTALAHQLAQLDIDEFHHGGCWGADTYAHDLALNTRSPLAVVIHPGPRSSLDWRGGDRVTMVAPRAPLRRNLDIVEAVDLLLAMPSETHEIRRSGTWATVRYARTKGIPRIVLWGDGRVGEDEGGY